MIILSKFAEVLDYLIFEKSNTKKMDAKTLAEQIGVEGSTITRYLRCERAPTIDNLVLLANYFNCTTDYLLGRDGENYSNTFKPCPPFPKQFRFLLKHYGYTCLQFSIKAEIHQSSVYDWKNGKRTPSLDNIIKIAEFFKCSVDFVLGREV